MSASSCFADNFPALFFSALFDWNRLITSLFFPFALSSATAAFEVMSIESDSSV